MIALILLVPIVLVFFLWFYGFMHANDFTVITRTIDEFNIKSVLIIFPHPDDEALSLSGTITKLVENNTKVNWIILTRGERGTSDAHLDESLGSIRTKEAQDVATILKIMPPIMSDFPDNGVVDKKDELKAYLKQQIGDLKPDLIITYDESGGYGHPDHIAVSQAITTLLKTDFPEIHLWYTSTPEKIFKALTLPTQMAKDQNYAENRKYPNFKIPLDIRGITSRIQVTYAHKSQLDSFVRGVPVKQIPLWFYISLSPYEYFHKVR